MSDSSSASIRGLPTLRSMDHLAYTVPDLDQAIAFFIDHFGATLVFRDGPFSGENDEMTERLDVDPRALCNLAMLRLGETMNLELFEYSAPDQNTVQPKNSDIGGHHLAFYVDDIDAAHAYIAQVPGVRLMNGPNEVAPNSPVAGQRWFYFATPWGLHMEITSDSRRQFYTGLPGAGMVSPAGLR